MKYLNISLMLFAGILLVGCNRGSTNDDYTDYLYVNENPQIQYNAVNDGRDLVVETNNQVLYVAGQPDKQYAYHVWIGDKDMTTSEPDIIVEQGEVFVHSNK